MAKSGPHPAVLEFCFACSMAAGAEGGWHVGGGAPEHGPRTLAAPPGVSLLTSFPGVSRTPGRPSRPRAVGRASGPNAAVSTGESFRSTS